MAVRVRAGGAADLGFLRALSREAFESFGDYERLLPEWARTPGIELTVAEDDAERVGVALLGFFEEPRRRTAVADLLAIAVAPSHRGQGVGRLLLEAAIKRARELARVEVVCALRLTVADGNTVARHLFESAGLEYVPDEEGQYPRGQRALRMELPLPRE
jgi:ribosomal protein S18 acetylase RimI-like enzyme